MANKTGVVMLVLILVIVVLLGIVAYGFLIGPKISGYVVGKQNEAARITEQYVLNQLLLQLQQQGYVQISDGQGNSILLVPAQQQQQAQG